jgi:hypothetical protein
MRTLLIAGLASVLIAAGGCMQAPTPPKVAEAPKVRQPWELEWAYLSKYHDANLSLRSPAPGERRVVFMGDSITENWVKSDPDYFSRNSYVGRGISGQTRRRCWSAFART